MATSKQDPFYSAKSRLARAEIHISNLETEIWNFRSNHPPDLIRELDPGGFTQTHKFKFPKPLPESCTHLSIEALEAIRSALDQIGYAAAVVSGNTRLKRTQFPISDSAAELNNLIDGRGVCRDIPEPIIALFRRFKPYRGGNDILWTLNKLRNSNHTHLVPVAMIGASVLIQHKPGSAELIALNPLFDGAKNEIAYARGPTDGHFEYGIHPSFQIGFHDTAITGRKHAVTILTGALGEVQQVLDQTELACCRLGFIE